MEASKPPLLRIAIPVSGVLRGQDPLAEADQGKEFDEGGKSNGILPILERRGHDAFG